MRQKMIMIIGFLCFCGSMVVAQDCEDIKGFVCKVTGGDGGDIIDSLDCNEESYMHFVFSQHSGGTAPNWPLTWTTEGCDTLQSWEDGDDFIVIVPPGICIDVTATDEDGCFWTRRYITIDICDTGDPCENSNIALSTLNTSIFQDSCELGTGQLGINTNVSDILWSTGDTTLVISNLNADNYSVTVTDENGCTAAEFYEVIAVDVNCDNGGGEPCDEDTVAPVVTILQSLTLPCEAAINVTSLSETLEIIDSCNTNIVIGDLSNGTVLVTVTDEAGNSTTISQEVIIEPITADITQTSDCTDSSLVVISINPNYTLVWENGDNSTERMFALGSGIETFTVTDPVTGCSETFSVLVDEAFYAEFTFSQGLCSGNDNVLDVNSVDNATISINENQESTDGHYFNDSVSIGEYFILVEKNGCSIDTSVLFEEIVDNVVSLQINNTECGQSTGSVIFNVENGSLITFNGEVETTSTAFEDLTNGFYGLATVTSPDGCVIITEAIQIWCNLAVQLYPNPIQSGNILNGILPGLPSDLVPETVTITVSNTMGGKAVFGPTNVDFVNEQFQLPTNAWGEPGMYFVTVSAVVPTIDGNAEIVRKTLKVSLQ